MLARCILVGLSALAFAAQAQSVRAPGAADLQREAPATRSRPSVPSKPSVPGMPLPSTDAPAAVEPGHSALLGAGSFGSPSSGAGLEGVLNTGTPSMYDRRAGPRKVCPPGLENRNNVCAAPLGSVLSH